MAPISSPVDITEKVVLINIGREWREDLTSAQLYERTRQYWDCNPNYHDAKYAMSVAQGIVREVYRIRGWHRVNLGEEVIDPTRLTAHDPLPKELDRWAFDGEVAPEMKHYVGASVSHYRTHGNSNPIRWLNCDKQRQAGVCA